MFLLQVTFNISKNQSRNQSDILKIIISKNVLMLIIKLCILKLKKYNLIKLSIKLIVIIIQISFKIANYIYFILYILINNQGIFTIL